MQNIQLYNKNNGKIYYIAVLDENTSRTVENIASSYKKITQVINYSAKKMYPTDITITDINNWVDTGTDKSVDYDISFSTSKAQADLYSYYVTATYITYTIKVHYDHFSKSQLQNLGSFLKTLIQHAHKHA